MAKKLAESYLELKHLNKVLEAIGFKIWAPSQGQTFENQVLLAPG